MISENLQNNNENNVEIKSKTDENKTKKPKTQNKNNPSKNSNTKSSKSISKKLNKNNAENKKDFSSSKEHSDKSKKTQTHSNLSKNKGYNSQNNVFLIKNSAELQNPTDEIENITSPSKKAKSNSDDGTFSNHKNTKINHKWWIDAILFIGGTIVLGLIAKFLGGKMSDFGDYTLPPYTPKSIIFPIAWSIIYIAIGVSTYLMWRDKEIKEDARKINLILYFVQMFFNILWPMFFFRLDMPIFAVFWLIVLIGVSCATMFRYFICNLPAGIIFNIYTLWLIYALYMNLGIVLINF